MSTDNRFTDNRFTDNAREYRDLLRLVREPRVPDAGAYAGWFAMGAVGTVAAAIVISLARRFRIVRRR